MLINWTEVEALANSCLVLTSVGAISYAGLQLRHEREYRSVANLEKQLGFFLSENFVAARRRLAQARLDVKLIRRLRVLKPWDLDAPPVSVFEVLDFYEHLSLLVNKGHLDVYDVWHTFYEWAQPVYVDHAEPDRVSRLGLCNEHYNDLQKLMRQMDEIQIKRMHEKNANHWALWTPERIIDHYRYELESGGRPRRTRNTPARDVAREVARELVREIQQAEPETVPISPDQAEEHEHA